MSLNFFFSLERNRIEQLILFLKSYIFFKFCLFLFKNKWIWDVANLQTWFKKKVLLLFLFTASSTYCSSRRQDGRLQSSGFICLLCEPCQRKPTYNNSLQSYWRCIPQQTETVSISHQLLYHWLVPGKNKFFFKLWKK